MPRDATAAPTVAGLLRDIAAVGADRSRGGYSRPVWSDAELSLRDWFVDHAGRRRCDVHTDRTGIPWAWWNPIGPPGRRGRDRQPPGLGARRRRLRRAARRRVRAGRRRPAAGRRGGPHPAAGPGRVPRGGGVPVRRRLPGLPAAHRGDRAGPGGRADRSRRHHLRRGRRPPRPGPRRLGVDRDALGRVGAFVELHVEQGRGLVDLGRPVAVGTSILGHGRWRFTVTGQGNHAGTTPMADRRDPMVAAARIVTAVRDTAAAVPDARATVGRLQPVPGGTNVIASSVGLWVDVRHPDDAVTAEVVRSVHDRACAVAAEEGCAVALVEESWSPTVGFDGRLRDRLAAALPGAPLLATGAGHDAGVLATHVPTGMLFVRNPTGISHAPEEHVDDADADVGAEGLATVLRDLLGGSADTRPRVRTGSGSPPAARSARDAAGPGTGPA